MDKQKILIYGMQSSGASLFTYFLSQIPNSIAVIDLYIQRVAPFIESQNTIILKATTSEFISFENHIEVFKPTFKILFIRNPLITYLSLNRKSYRNHGGLAEKKIKKIDTLFKKSNEIFDMTIHYEDFIANPKRIIEELANFNIMLPANAFKFNRTIDDVVEYSMKNCLWCKNEFGIQWGTGNIHIKNLESLKVNNSEIPYGKIIDKVKRLSPSISKYYKL